MKRFDAVAASPEQKEAWVHYTFQNISEKYDMMNDVESFGLHRRWKNKLVKKVCATQPADVLDVACGTGDIALEMARVLPYSNIVGVDFSTKMLDVARRRAKEDAEENPRLAHVEFLDGNALALPFASGSFNSVSVSFGLRNMIDYRAAISEMTRVLRPGGSFFCLEASYPTTPIIKQAFKLYFRYIMPWVAELLTRKPAEYKWLNDSTEVFLSKNQLADLMRECGLSAVKYKSFVFGAAALHWGIKP